MYYFVEIACVISELLMVLLLFGGSYSKRECPSWVKILLPGLVGGVMVLLSLWEGMAFVRIGFCFVAFLAIGAVFFSASIFRCGFVSLIICALAALADVLMSAIMLGIHFDMQSLMGNGTARSIYLIADHILLFALIACVYAISTKGGDRVSAKILIPVIPCFGVSCLLCIILARQLLLGNPISPLYPAVLVGMLYINIVVIYYANRITVQERERREQELAEHHYAMQQEYYTQFRIQQEETRALWHDISKFLRAAKAEGSGNAYAQVEQMLESVVPVVDVDNRVVSIILNEYAQECKSMGIVLELDIRVPQELFVTAVDLYVLIGNTMDNAIRAVEELPGEDRKISVKLKTHNQILFYEIENTYSEKQSAHSRGKIHGYGLQNVKRCVERYNGTVEITHRESTFQVVAHLNCP